MYSVCVLLDPYDIVVHVVHVTMYTLNLGKKCNIFAFLFTLKEKKIKEEPSPKLKSRKRSWRSVQKVYLH